MRASVSLHDLGIARKDSHARTDCGLGKIYGRDVAALEVLERTRKLGFEGINELAARR
jgi:hypothetical protein